MSSECVEKEPIINCCITKKQVSMALEMPQSQTSPWHCEEETQNMNSYTTARTQRKATSSLNMVKIVLQSEIWGKDSDECWNVTVLNIILIMKFANTCTCPLKAYTINNIRV